MVAKNNGAFEREYATVRVDALTNANSEPWDPAANTTFSDPAEVTVVGYDSAATYTVEWDHTQQAFVFATTADGTDPGSGTDVGELKAKVEGRR